MLHIIAVRTFEQTTAHANILENYLDRADIFSPAHKGLTLGDLFDQDMAYSQLRSSRKTFKELSQSGEFVLEGDISPYFQRAYELAQKYKKPQIHLIDVLSKKFLDEFNALVKDTNTHIIEAEKEFLEQTDYANEIITTASYLLARARGTHAFKVNQTIERFCYEHAPSDALTTWIIALNHQHSLPLMNEFSAKVKKHAPRAMLELVDTCPQPLTLMDYAVSKQYESFLRYELNERINAEPASFPETLITDLLLEALFVPPSYTFESLFANAYTIATLDPGEKQILIKFARDNSDVLLSDEGPIAANNLAETCGIRVKNPADTFAQHYPFDWETHYSSQAL